eukprot:SAG11_NODE_15830_length_565_cov_0.974249_1_plen_77_part_10
MGSVSLDEARLLRQKLLSGGSAETLDLRGRLLSREAAEVLLGALAQWRAGSNPRTLRLAQSTLHGLPWEENGVRALT